MPATDQTTLDTLCIDTLRTLAIDAVERANSGHPGLPLGAAPMAYVLWQRYLKHDPEQPAWYDRDRFVLSAGHGSMLLYALLHVYGYDLALEDLERFRQWGARTPGHPEHGLTPGVEATTGPLGQGAANAVGMALAERFLAQRFNRPGHTVVDHYTYALVSDGDLMEGVSSEAASLAGHLGLGKLVYLYDANDVTLDGPASMHFSEDVAARYAAYGWHVERVADGDTDLAAIDAAIARAREERTRPSIVIVRTTIGYGSPHKAGSFKAHGSPLGAEEVALTKKALGWDPKASFLVPERARAGFRAAAEHGREAHAAWRARLESWAARFPELEAERRLSWAGELPVGWDADLPRFETGAKLATRVSGGKVLNAIAKRVPWLLGGDADLGGSTKTTLAGEADYTRESAGRNLHFGVREHAMGSIANGIAYHGGARAFTATFFVFSDYMRPPIRLAAMNHLPVTFVFTHDSIGLGEDGPTHQPVEHLASLRAMPNLVVLRPCDAHEATQAWRIAMTEKRRPIALVLSRQDLPTLAETAAKGAGTARGAYVLSPSPTGSDAALLIASGSEVHLALAAQRALAAKGLGARVVSMPSWELFAEQDETYRESVLPAQVVKRVAIEAGSSFGWSRWIGPHGRTVTVDRYGASAPAEVLFERYGFTPAAVVAAVEAQLG